MRITFADAQGRWLRVSSHTHGFEAHVRPAVWHMVQTTYAKIGLILDHPSELDEYDVWDVYQDHTGELHAFVLGKTTPYGIKLGLLGSDGSKLGRSAVRDYAAEWYKQPGHYGEVSHRMEELAIDAGAPAVCGMYVPEILSKDVLVEADGVHYRRKIKNVGEVTKIVVGRPRGIPVTSGQDPRCPRPSPAMAGRRRLGAADASADTIFAHAASLVTL